jgi:hypothetical protein
MNRYYSSLRKYFEPKDVAVELVDKDIFVYAWDNYRFRLYVLKPQDNRLTFVKLIARIKHVLRK